MSVSLWTTHTDDRRQAWHVIIALGLLILFDDMKRGMPTWPFGSSHGRMMSGITSIFAFGQHTWSHDVGRGMSSSPWTAHKVVKRRAWHDIIALGQHTWSDDVGRGMPSFPLERPHGRMT